MYSFKTIYTAIHFKLKAYILIIFIMSSMFVLAQRTEMAIDFNQKTNRLVVEIENDMLFKSDHYYTSGTALIYMNKKMKHSPAIYKR